LPHSLQADDDPKVKQAVPFGSHFCKRDFAERDELANTLWTDTKELRHCSSPAKSPLGPHVTLHSS